MQAGFATIYTFWCYPSQTRIRVSQVLVPPPNQGKGVGRALLEAAYITSDERGAVDITVIAPSHQHTVPCCSCQPVLTADSLLPMS